MKWFSAWDVMAFGVLAVVTLLVVVGCGDSATNTSAEEAEAAAIELIDEAPEWPITEDPNLLAGMQVFAEVCHHCHIEGEYLPNLSDHRQWRQRIKKNSRDGAVARDVFVKHAYEGFGDMMPKGGRRGVDLTEEQVAAGVDYMLWAVAELSPPEEE